jgi:XTP/dITP diphosphohydrolase
VYAAAEGDQVAALRAAGVEVRIVEPVAGELLAAVARHGTVVWLSSPAGDQSLARDLGMRLARQPGLAELELAYGSWDPPGGRLLDVVTVVDRLASPGGDPWLATFFEADQDNVALRHGRLAHYLLEEAYEAHDAIFSEDRDAIREELGDVLFQVVLHARLAQGDPMAGGKAFDVDDVAGDLVEKLIRRNPHVFGDVTVADVEEIAHNWERIKREEKQRASAMDGIALSQPALSLAAKVLARAERAGHPITVPSGTALSPEAAVGGRLLDAVAAARAEGIDAESALRTLLVKAITDFRVAESP